MKNEVGTLEGVSIKNKGALIDGKWYTVVSPAVDFLDKENNWDKLEKGKQATYELNDEDKITFIRTGSPASKAPFSKSNKPFVPNINASQSSTRTNEYWDEYNRKQSQEGAAERVTTMLSINEEMKTISPSAALLRVKIESVEQYKFEKQNWDSIDTSDLEREYEEEIKKTTPITDEPEDLV